VFVFAEFSTRVLYKATNMNGYVGIILGCGITMIVQSSSITTSTFTPLVGVGALRLEQMLPITLGANLGTTLTALLSALVSESVDSLQVALCHLFFNITGVFLFYPIPMLRNIPLAAARALGKATRIWRGIPIVYLAVMFFAVPGFFLGLSSLFTTDVKGLAVIGSFIVIAVSFAFAYLAYWIVYKDGRNKTVAAMQQRERRRSTFKELPDTMENLLKRIETLEKQSGVVGNDKDDDEDVPEIEA
jgi:sodium-dependent phosphate cotransporter